MSLCVLVVGGGRVGASLAQILVGGGHDVTIVDDRPAVVQRLRDQVTGAAVYEGGATDPATLESAGIRRADVVAAVTAADEQNLVVTGLARLHFGVPRTVARIVDPARSWLYSAEMGVDVALDQADLIARVVAEELSLGEMVLLAKLRRGRYSLVEERVHPRASAVDRRLDDLALPADCAVVAVLRGDELLLRDAAVRLRPGDEVVAVVHADSAHQLAELLGPAAGVTARG